MGNSAPHPGPTKPAQQKFDLELRDREIIVDFRNKRRVIIGDILSFPSGGFEGLHLWDSHIILARYIVKNKQLFSGKSVVELLAGTGIASIAARKFTSAGKIAATDKRPQVVDNLSNNCHKNGIDSGIILACLSMSEHVNYKSKYDLVIGADILCKSVCLADLEGCIVKLLDVGGQALFVVPYQNLEIACEFIDGLDGEMFSWSKQKLVDEIYMESPLLNQVQGYELFPQIAQSTFFVYKIQKITNKVKSEADKSQVQPSRKASSQIPMIKQSIVRHAVKKPAEQLEQIEIREQFLDDQVSEHERELQRTEHLKKQLQVVTLKVQQDLPEYEKKKKRGLSEIISSDKKINPAEQEAPVLQSNSSPGEETVKKNQQQGKQQKMRINDSSKNQNQTQGPNKIQEAQFKQSTSAS